MATNNTPYEDLRNAARDFMVSFWDDDDAGPIARAALRQAWDVHKRKPEYEALRQRLSEAMKALPRKRT